MGSFKLGKMTLKSLFGKPETVCYPVQEKPVPAGRRGQIENDMEACILCGVCVKACPAGVLSVDKKEGTWSINRFGCVQCNSCVRVCPKKCLSCSTDFVKPSAEQYITTLTKPEESEEEKAAKEAAKQAKIEAAMKAKAEREAKASQ